MEEKIIAEGVVPLQTVSLLMEEEIIAQGVIFSKYLLQILLKKLLLWGKKTNLLQIVMNLLNKIGILQVYLLLCNNFKESSISLIKEVSPILLKRYSNQNKMKFLFQLFDDKFWNLLVVINFCIVS